MRILFLYSEVVGYLLPVFRRLNEFYGAEIVVIHWDRKKLKPFQPQDFQGVSFRKRSQFTKASLKSFCMEYSPHICYVSGWMDREYLSACRKLRASGGIPVVVGFDDIWTNSMRQRIGAFLFPLYLKKCFSHAWVAGPYQYYFAKRLGFRDDNIIFDLLTANTAAFCQTNDNAAKAHKEKSFLYVGNFREIKGTRILLEGYRHYRDELKGTWNLTCIGNGELDVLFSQHQDVRVIGFSSEQEIVSIAKDATVFVLPSIKDQWGVVVHEFTTLGMPLILSENVGAKSTFLIDGYNGFLYPENSALKLALAMYRFEQASDRELFEMGTRSRHLASRISVETTAANLMSILVGFERK